MDTDLMTLKDLSEYLRMSDRTLYRYAQKGLLPGIKIGKGLALPQGRHRRLDRGATPLDRAEHLEAAPGQVGAGCRGPE